MRVVSALVLMACVPPGSDPVVDNTVSWGNVTGEDVVPSVWYVSQNADGDEVGAVDESTLCSGGIWVGGQGPFAACLADAVGPVAVLTRSEAGETVRFDGPEAVCPVDWTLVGQQGEAAVCVGDAPGVVATLSSTDGVGTPAPECPTGWQALGSRDFSRVCARPGLGAVIQLSRTVTNETVSNVPAEALCPDGSTFLARQRRVVLCDVQQPATVIRVSRGLFDPLNPDQPTCPLGWRWVGGLDRASVCLLDTAVVTVSVTRGLLDELPLQTGSGECPDGAERLGWDAGASVCGYR